MNKKGAQKTMIWVIGILVVGFLLYRAGVFETSVPSENGDDGLVPSDLETTFTLSFKDELATAETAVSSALWYAFRASDGTYVNSGTASSGTASFTTTYGEDYDIWAYTTGYAGYIAKKTRVSGTAPDVSTAIALVKRGGTAVGDVDDPVDNDGNISGTAGQMETFRVKWNVNVSNAGILDPVIYLQANNTATGVEDITVAKTDSAGGEWTEVTCPARIKTDTVNQMFYCFKRDRIAYSSDGVISTNFVVKIDDSTTLGKDDYVNVSIADTGMYLKPGYSDISGVLFGVEDGSDSDVGTPADGRGVAITFGA